MTWDAATKYRLLLELNNAIVNETSRSRLFKALAARIRRIFHYDRFSINIYNPRLESFSYFASADGISPAGMTEEERPAEKGAIANAVVRTRRPFISPDLSAHSYWESVRVMQAAGLNATMAYPLIIRDRVIGTLHFSFVQAPPDMNELDGFLNELSKQVAIAVDNMMSHTELMAVNEHLKRQKDFLLTQSENVPGLEDFYYACPAMKEVVRQAQIIADSDASVLITGETGTGKDHIANCVHALSSRREALIVKVNCPALTPTLFESELFGHAKGAFTGAHANRIGRFEMADGGTVFLDEIGELGTPLQAKLLNVLQDRVFERVGDSRPLKVDFRLISSTNVDLEKSIRKGAFRSDLYYRLNTFSIHLPPLRDRLADVPVLVDRLAAAQARKINKAQPIFTDSCFRAMGEYSWPGNVRELKNLVKRLVIMKPGEFVSGRDIEAILHQVQPAHPDDFQTMAEVERRHIIRTLARTNGRVGGPQGAAALLGLKRQTLQYRMKKYGIKAGGR